MTTEFSTEILRHRLKPAARVMESDDSPEAAVAVIIDSSGDSLLLIKRTERLGDPWSGQVAFPGGHIASSDRSFLETAIREAREEVGISLRGHSVLGVLPLIYARTRRVKVAPFVFQLKTSVDIRANVEVADVFWVSANELARSKVLRSRVDVEDGQLMVDSYVWGKYVIWGLTFRIINLLLGKNEL